MQDVCNDGGAWRRDRGGHSHEDNSPLRTNYSCPPPSPDPIPYPTRNPAFPLPRGSTKEQQRSREETSTPLSKTISDTLGLVIKGNVSGNPSRDQMFSLGWDRDITVMMVMQIVVLVVVL